MSAPDDFKTMREQLHRQILSAVSHDLKTPLATIIGSLEIHQRMESSLSREKREILLSAALSEAYRLDNFITNILDMAKLESGMVRIRQETCNLAHLINDCIIKLGPRRNRCDIRFVPPSVPPYVQADPMLLGRAIGLVLENAMKHGGSQPVICITCSEDSDLYAVRVRDHGPGLPPGKEDAIFSKYTRFAKSDQQNAGTGLGLALCRELMALHGGAVRGETHPDGGALFTLSLPLQNKSLPL